MSAPIAGGPYKFELRNAVGVVHGVVRNVAEAWPGGGKARLRIGGIKDRDIAHRVVAGSQTETFLRPIAKDDWMFLPASSSRRGG